MGNRPINVNGHQNLIVKWTGMSAPLTVLRDDKPLKRFLAPAHAACRSFVKMRQKGLVDVACVMGSQPGIRPLCDHSS
jgi:hypothetical protein